MQELYQQLEGSEFLKKIKRDEKDNFDYSFNIQFFKNTNCKITVISQEPSARGILFVGAIHPLNS